MITFYILALISEIIGTVGGFGSSVFFVPIATFFFEPKIVLGLTALLHVFSNLAKLILFWKHIDYRIFKLFGIPGIIGVAIGAFASVYLIFTYGSLMLGIFLLSFAILFLIRPSLKIAPTPKNAVTGGSIAGFLAGLIGTGGAVRGAAMAAYNLEKSAFVATSAAIDMGVDITRTFIYLGNDYLQAKEFSYIPMLIAVSFVGSWIGKRMLQQISQLMFRKIVLILIGLIGIVSIIHYLY
ncbi:MAG: sulfite exporter TauE/SafE family protein [Bacteroidetes bacterium]|nr:sulfite exporter TauE/SafE family protein [Bacteroidota bacterium]